MAKPFTSTAASKNKDVNFNLDMVVRPDNYSIAGLKAVPPRWRAGLPARDIANMKLLRKFDGELGNKTAWEMLTELEKRLPTYLLLPRLAKYCRQNCRWPIRVLTLSKLIGRFYNAAILCCHTALKIFRSRL